MKLESENIKRCSDLNEKWVQDQVADDPSILGLGDLAVKDQERIQSGGGRMPRKRSCKHRLINVFRRDIINLRLIETGWPSR